MSKKNPAVLWTVNQSLSLSKTEKEQARTNIGMENFQTPKSDQGSALSFVSSIDEDTYGNLRYNKQSVTVELEYKPGSTNPASGQSIKAAMDGLATVATSGSYNDLDNIPTDLVHDANYVHTDNNFTDADVSKLAGIEAGAEVNVQSDWTETDNTSDAYIQHKPNLATVATSGLYNDLINIPPNIVQDPRYVHTDQNFTQERLNKLEGIEAGAEVNVINKIKVNGIAQSVTNKTVDISVGAGIFVGQYSQSLATPYNDYKTAYDAGKAVFLKVPAPSGDTIYQLYDIDADKAVFTCTIGIAGSSYPTAHIQTIIVSSSNVYSSYDTELQPKLSTATSSTAGIVKSATTGTTADRDYNVEVNGDGTMKVNVPWKEYSSGTGMNLSSGGTFSRKSVVLTNTDEIYSTDNRRIVISNAGPYGLGDWWNSEVGENGNGTRSFKELLDLYTWDAVSIEFYGCLVIHANRDFIGGVQIQTKQEGSSNTYKKIGFPFIFQHYASTLDTPHPINYHFWMSYSDWANLTLTEKMNCKFYLINLANNWAGSPDYYIKQTVMLRLRYHGLR